MEASLNQAINKLKIDPLTMLPESEFEYAVNCVDLCGQKIGYDGNGVKVHYNLCRWRIEVVKNGITTHLSEIRQPDAKVLLDKFTETFGSLDSVVEILLAIDGSVKKITF